MPRHWAFVDRLDDEGNLVGSLVQIDVSDRPYGGPSSFGELFRERRTAARISLHHMAVTLCYTTSGQINAVDVSDVESGRTSLTSIEQLAWLGALAKLEREGARGD